MILGNFMLLSEVDPKLVHEWFLAIYIDAIEWVEMPNVLGMSQYADGGLLATKPYVSSGSYINKMGNYCKSCQYDVKTKFADNSCPFNSLYWSFFLNNPTLLENNPRMGIVKMQINKMKEEDRGLYIKKSKQILKNIEQL
jgi:deoxyribodipyrimidine photolyase-related protein